MQIHAWINVYLIWSKPSSPDNPNHILNIHPDWQARPYKNENTDDIYLSPGLPEVRNHLLNVTREIVDNYQIDGLHLDYIRYPGEEYDFHPAVRILFAQKYGVDPLSLFQEPQYLNNLFGEEKVESLNKKRIKWRANQITLLVKKIEKITENKGIKLSAAVKPDPKQAYEKYGQDWPGWMNKGILDFCVPMVYTNNIEIFSEEVTRIREATKEGEVYIGIGAYNQPFSETIKQIKKVRNFGMKGFCLFSYNYLKTNQDLGRLKDILKE